MKTFKYNFLYGKDTLPKTVAVELEDGATQEDADAKVQSKIDADDKVVRVQSVDRQGRPGIVQMLHTHIFERASVKALAALVILAAIAAIMIQPVKAATSFTPQPAGVAGPQVLLTSAIANGQSFNQYTSNSLAVNPPNTTTTSSFTNSTSFVNMWPAAIGSNFVGIVGATNQGASINTNTALVAASGDITNITRIPVGAAKDVNLEFVGQITNGYLADGAFGSVVIRIAGDNQSAPIYENTNGCATRANANGPPIATGGQLPVGQPAVLYSWIIASNNITMASGGSTIDVTTNLSAFSNLITNGSPLSTSLGNLYIYDIAYVANTSANNGLIPFLTNYAIFINAK
jgi:hypothetical protein